MVMLNMLPQANPLPPHPPTPPGQVINDKSLISSKAWERVEGIRQEAGSQKEI